jgi:hypothetical protein
LDIGRRKVSALEQQRKVRLPRKRIAAAISEIQTGWIPSSFAEAQKGISCNMCLGRGEGNDFGVDGGN